MSIQTVTPEMPPSVIQTLLDVAGPFGKVKMLPGNYHLTKPLFMPGNTTLEGLEDPRQTVLHAEGSFFPLIVHTPPENQSVPVIGDALVLDGTMGYWVNLSADCHFALSLSGIVPFTVKFDLWLDSLPNDERTIMASQGRAGMFAESHRQAFAINVYQGSVWVLWNWDGNRHLIQTEQVLLTNQWQVIELEFDGTTATLMVDGVVVGTELAGPIQQAYHEDICVGAIPIHWPDGHPGASMVNGKIRNVHVTGSSPYSVPSDIHPVFEECYGPMVPIETTLLPGGNSIGRFWTVLRRPGGEQAPVVLRNFMTQGGSGIYLQSAVNSTIENVELNQGINGFTLYDNCYKSVMRNVRVNGGRFGCAWVSAAWLCLVENFQFQDCIVGLMVSDGSGTARNGLLYGGHMAVAVVVKGDWPSLTLDAVSYGDEGQGTPPSHGILASNVRGLLVLGGGSGYFVYPITSITLEQCQGVSITGTLFGIMPETPGLIRVVSQDLDQVAVVSYARVGATGTDVSSIPLFVS